jgi:hypothetical protein
VNPRISAATTCSATADGRQGSASRSVQQDSVGIRTPTIRATRSTTVGRLWLDFNGNTVPDCDLTNPNQQVGADLCGAWDNLNFGKPTVVGLRPAILNRWGVRPYSKEFSAGVQELIPPLDQRHILPAHPATSPSPTTSSWVLRITGTTV